MATWRDVCEEALLELNIIAAGDPASGTDAVFALAKLNRIINRWNADRKTIYDERFDSFTLTANLQPHTIGLTADAPTFVVTGNRPQTIDGANIITGTGTSAVRHPVRIRDRHWWLGQTSQATTSSIPTDLYYDAGWPNGSLHLWPVPDTARTIELMTRRVLAVAALGDTFALPPGYQEALTLTLAEELAGPFERQVPAQLAMSARRARVTIFDANDVTPQIGTVDSGTGARGRTFDYRTGLMS